MSDIRLEKKEPLIRIVRRQDIKKSSEWMIRISAFIVAILIGAVIFVAIGHNPFSAYAAMIKGSLGKASGIRQVAKIATPLLGTAVALAPCFKMKYWNIGAEGQITMGAMAGAYFALHFGKTWPAALLLPVMAIASILFGGLWSIIPAFFKSKYNTNETLFTLMMNYIAIGIVAWLQGGPWEGNEGSQIIPNFEKAAVLPKLFGVHCGWIIVLVITFAMFVYMKYTKHGFEIAVLGDSENTARYAGMNVRLVIMRTAFLSGAISGLVGFMISSGANQTLYKDMAGGVGFTAITVAWLAQLNPFAMIAIAILLGVLSKGASALQTSLSVPVSISDILTGIILMSMLACEFFINYRLIFRGSLNGKETK